MSKIRMNNLMRFNLDITFGHLDYVHKLITFFQIFYNAYKELIIGLCDMSLEKKLIITKQNCIDFNNINI